MSSNLRRLVVLSLCWATLLACLGCSKKPAGKRFELEGRVVAVDSSGRILTVAHGDVPQLMPAMTMPFQVAKNEDWVFGKIAPGDHIHATLVMTDHAELQDISFTSGGNPAGDGTSHLHLPDAGDAVPDFQFLNQFGKAVRLSQFRGKPLLLTFVYTRCPFPDFCPLMSNNFASVLKQLRQVPAIYPKTQLLSISIDPKFDTPRVLHEYGERYVAKTDPQFEHWQFVTGSPEGIRKAADFFGLAYNQQEGQIVHNLRTVLVGSDGKIIKVYSGNQWKPEEVVRDYAQAAAGGS